MLLNVFDMDIYCELTPVVNYFEGFVKDYRSPDIYLWPEARDDYPSAFGWASPHLDISLKTSDLYDRIASLKALFDGAMRIYVDPEWYGLPFPRILSKNSINLGVLPSSVDITVDPFSSTIITKNFTEDYSPRSNVSKAIFLARFDKEVLDILRYVSYQGMSYITLYALYDWMKKGKWDNNRIGKEANWSATQLNDFTNTANNPVFLGPYCRHGGSTGSAPKRPMLLKDAIPGIISAIRAYIEEKGNNINIQSKLSSLVV